MKIAFVVAVGENGVIGAEGGLPWRLKSDMQHFRAVTYGKPVIMGRRTWLSLPGPLKGRTNIVITRDPDFAARGVVVARSIGSALEVARGDALRRGADEIAVIGGTDIFEQMLPQADRLIVTHVRISPAGDRTFPAIDPGLWAETARTEHQPGPEDDAGFSVVSYTRR